MPSSSSSSSNDLDSSSRAPLIAEYEKEVVVQKQKRSLSSFFLQACIWIVHSILFSLYVTSLFRKNTGCHGAFPTEIESVGKWIEYEDVLFVPSGFTNSSSQAEYEGPPTPEVDAAWENIYDVGIYALTREENEKLPTPSARFYEEPERYPVFIAMYHQIHCLDRLRKIAWGDTKTPNNQPLDVELRHTDHCLNYLRQTLLCHGDTTPIPLYEDKYQFGEPTYTANWEVHHTCRNADKIHEWARLGNTTGLKV